MFAFQYSSSWFSTPCLICQRVFIFCFQMQTLLSCVPITLEWHIYVCSLSLYQCQYWVLIVECFYHIELFCKGGEACDLTRWMDNVTWQVSQAVKDRFLQNPDSFYPLWKMQIWKRAYDRFHLTISPLSVMVFFTLLQWTRLGELSTYCRNQSVKGLEIAWNFRDQALDYLNLIARLPKISNIKLSIIWCIVG